MFVIQLLLSLYCDSALLDSWLRIQEDTIINSMTVGPGNQGSNINVHSAEAHTGADPTGAPSGTGLNDSTNDMELEQVHNLPLWSIWAVCSHHYLLLL